MKITWKGTNSNGLGGHDSKGEKVNINDMYLEVAVAQIEWNNDK